MLVAALLPDKLTGRAAFSKKKNVGGNLYQPPILALQAGQTIATKEGNYTPTTDEIWHSDRRYRELEEKVLFKP